MDKYYLREKIFNSIGVFITMLFIVQGWEFVFNPNQILVIVLIRYLLVQKKGMTQSILLILFLYVGYLWEYHPIVIQYYEYVMLAFFFAFLLYSIYVGSSIKRLRNLILAVLGMSILISVHINITNNRLFPDPQFQKVVNRDYEYRFRTNMALEEDAPYLEKMTDLSVSSKWGVKTLEGIENLTSLKSIGIYDQGKLMDYSKLQELSNLKRLSISDPHPDFSISHLSELESIESLSIYFRRNQSFEETIEIPNFPNLQGLSLLYAGNQEPVTIDIREIPSVETLELRMNVEKIIGLEEAKNLKRIILYSVGDDYRDEIKRLRPEIELH